MRAAQTHYILGPGAVGSVLGRALAAHGAVTFIGRAIGEASLVISFADPGGGESLFSAPYQTVGSPGPKIGSGDILWITTPAHEVVNVVSAVRERLSPETVAVVCSNGLGLSDDVRQVLGPKQPVVRVGITFGACRESNRAIRLSSPLAAGVACEAGGKGRDIYQTLEQAGFSCWVSASAAELEWRKMVINAAINLVVAPRGLRNGAILGDETLEQESRAVCREVVALAEARGVRLHGDVEQLVRETILKTAENECSTLVALRRGDLGETRAIFGRLAALLQGEAAPTLRGVLGGVLSL